MNQLPKGLAESVQSLAKVRDERKRYKEQFGKPVERAPWEPDVTPPAGAQAGDLTLEQEREGELMRLEHEDAKRLSEELHRKRQAGEFDMPPDNIE